MFRKIASIRRKVSPKRLKIAPKRRNASPKLDNGAPKRHKVTILFYFGCSSCYFESFCCNGASSTYL